ncbi:hypothetical protein [Streptomyces sp. M41]
MCENRGLETTRGEGMEIKKVVVREEESTHRTPRIVEKRPSR